MRGAALKPALVLARLLQAFFHEGRAPAPPGSVGTLPHAAAEPGPPQPGVLPSPSTATPLCSSAFISEIKDNNLKAVLEIQEVILFLQWMFLYLESVGCTVSCYRPLFNPN